MKDKSLLRVRGLHVNYRTEAGLLRAVNGVSFDIERGESVAIVGESGCGKSSVALSLLGLLSGRNIAIDGRIEFSGMDLRTLPRHRLQSIRGHKIAMVFQDPLTSLNPYLRVGTQISEPMRYHLGFSKAEARAHTIDLLHAVGINDPAASLKRFPHEFSGGMRQRTMIAAALSCSPDLLVADEPTTALDVTVQAQILDLIRRERERREMSLILITHDLGVVAGLCDRVIVMYGGQVVEESSAEQLYAEACHPYTQSLLRAIPRYDFKHSGPLFSLDGQPPDLIENLDGGCAFEPRCEFRKDKCVSEVPVLRLDSRGRKHRCLFELDLGTGLNVTKCHVDESSILKADLTDRPDAILTVEGLEVSYDGSGGLWFGRREPAVKAVNCVSLSLRKGETLGLVGESGCGKSTLARAVVGLVGAQAGKVSFEGNDLLTLSTAALRVVRREIQLIFQDPRSSLNPRLKAWELVSEPLVNFGLAKGAAALREAERLMELVGLDRSGLKRYPHEFSGGQCQRLGIARALALNPKVLICDEPVSSLDVSIQAQILNLLMELQASFELSLIFISHDLSVVRQISDRVAVMYQGRIVESADAEEIYQKPKHPYTRALLSAIPIPDPTVPGIRCQLHSPEETAVSDRSGDGCDFSPRCPWTRDRCRNEIPILDHDGSESQVACFFWKQHTEDPTRPKYPESIAHR